MTNNNHAKREIQNSCGVKDKTYMWITKVPEQTEYVVKIAQRQSSNFF